MHPEMEVPRKTWGAWLESKRILRHLRYLSLRFTSASIKGKSSPMPAPVETPLIKPSDANSWSSCVRRVWLDNMKRVELVPATDVFGQLIIDLGMRHEQLVLDRLSSMAAVKTATSPEDTNRLIEDRTPIIYQAQLLDQENGIIGFPDFLILNESGEYQAADAKLALNENKKEIQVQLGVYRHLLRKKLNSQLPAIVFLGNGRQGFIAEEADQITDQFLTQMRKLLSSKVEPLVRYSHSKCRACPYYIHCKPAFEAKGELSLLYGMQGRAASALEHAGICTITQLAATNPDSIPDVPYLKGCEKKLRVVSQAKSHLTGEVIQLAPVSLPVGHWIHFDIEDNPLTANGEKHVYLWGFLVPELTKDGKQDLFEFVWTDHTDEDEQGWLQFLAQVEHYRQQHQDLILAHYSNHEKTTIRSYAKRYSMEDNETVVYLLSDAGPLFDMQKPVLKSLVLPIQGYGLKDICKHKDLVNFQWQDDDAGSQWSVVQFNRFLAQSNVEAKEKLKADILSYNRDDVMATRELEKWLRTKFIASADPG